MKYRNIYKILASLIACVAFSISCTNLDVVPYNQLTADNFYNNRLEIVAGVMRPYTHGNAWAAPTGQTGSWRVNEMSSDQLAWPQKGRHGYDAGDHGRLHYRTWTTTVNDGGIWNPWRLMFWGLGFVNNTLYDFENVVNWERAGLTIADRDAYIGELRAMRAWHYLRLMDLYGNIPLVTSVGNDGNPHPKSTPRAEVFAFIEAELLDIAENMFLLEESMSGRLTRAGVYSLLVDLYLNAEVYTGTPRWDDVIKFADKISNGDGGSLRGTNVKPTWDTDNFRTFANNNYRVSYEPLFTIAYSRTQGMWLGRSDFGSYNERDMINSRDNGNNGIVVQPPAFRAYDLNDRRRNGWFMYGIEPYQDFAQTPLPVVDRTVRPQNRIGMLRAPYRNIGGRSDRPNTYVLGTEEFDRMPLIFANQPIVAWINVSGTPTPRPDAANDATRTITITRWESPEFPDPDLTRYAKSIEIALNGNLTKQNLITRFDARDRDGNLQIPKPAGFNVVQLSGGYNTTDDRQYDWSPLNDYRYIWQDAKENTGARVLKYQHGAQTEAEYGNNHFAIYRYSWIQFAKAEALWRKSGITGAPPAGTLDIVNIVRNRAGVTPYTAATLTTDEFLAERGREFIAEGKRRQDLIRFGHFHDFGARITSLDFEGKPFTWWDSPNSGYGDGSDGATNAVNGSRHIELFGIPYNATMANPNLSQNPGYH